jgi:high-affinity iron transporter
VKRLLVLAVLALVAVLATPGVAAAKQNDVERARTENAVARTLVDQSFQAAKHGDYERAYELARSAYLDHYEYVEIPLRLRDPNLVLDTEFEFAELRNALQDRRPLDDVRDTVVALRSGILDTDRRLADPGVAAPAVALGFSFAILFREGVEAVLLIAILLGGLAAGQASGYKRPLAFGVAGAVVASGVTWALATLVLDIAPVNRELLEGIMALLAVIVLIAVSFWLISRIEHRRRVEFMRARVAGAIAAGSSTAFALLGFTAVYREGFETVLFYKALAIFAQGLGVWIAIGAGLAVAALGAVAYAILGLGRKLPIKPMLVTGASILLVLSVAFAGNAVRSLQGSDVISATPVNSDIVRLPVLLAEMTGIHPTREGLITQGVLASILLLGAAFVFIWQPARRRRSRDVVTA